MTSQRRAFTLLEVIIAISLFIAVIAVAFQSMIATRRYQVIGETHDEVFVYDSERILERIASDLGTSGWYFYGKEDLDNDNILDPGEDLDSSGTLNDIDYTVAGRDRSMLYFPYVTGNTSASRGTAFPTRVDPTVNGEFTRLSPWTATRFPSWTAGQVTADKTALVNTAKRMHLVVPTNLAATNPNAIDLAAEMVQPSNELIFLRVGVGPWNADPNEIDRGNQTDMIFFPSYGWSGSSLVVPSGAPAHNWRIADNYANLPLYNSTQTVRHMSAYEDDGTGTYKHRNSLLPVADPDYRRPYGVQAWGAAINQGASGPSLRIQFETIQASRMYFDPANGQDYLQPPPELRDYIYAVVPSPRGFGRLVRAHAVTGIGGTVGVEPGQRITSTAEARGYQIDLVLSDDVVRMQWTTRRHDRTLAANQVRLRMVLAKQTSETTTEDASRQMLMRRVDMVFSMLARNEYDDQKAAADKIDIPAGNVPFTF